jgi:electron-transferring-flavoprotein dehydrogenase
VVHGLGWPLKESGSPPAARSCTTPTNNQVYLGLHHGPQLRVTRTSRPTMSSSAGSITRRPSSTSRAARGSATVPAPLPRAASIRCRACTFPAACSSAAMRAPSTAVKIKGNHTAMKSGLVAAEAVVEGLLKGDRTGAGCTWPASRTKFKQVLGFTTSSTRTRNFSGFMHKFGFLLGSGHGLAGPEHFRRSSMPFTLNDSEARPRRHEAAAETSARRSTTRSRTTSSASIKLSSVFLSNTNHEEDQPCHLTLKDPERPHRAPISRSTTSRRSATARPACTRWWKRQAAASAFRSTRRTACTARPATSRTRRRTSSG